MTGNKSSSVYFIFLLLIMIIIMPSLVEPQACKRTCGNIPIKYPFGTGGGCGDRRFHQYINCDYSDNQKLTLTTHTGTYTVTQIDYANQLLYIWDPSISTCACNQPSSGFGLDSDAPFSFSDDDVFTLLNCSPTSPIFQSSSGNATMSSVPLCDKQGAPICTYLYSCRAIAALNFPISTCCVYTPVDLGPAFTLDLHKLQCSSYSAFYGFPGQDIVDPDRWKYGIALKYKFNVRNEYPPSCGDCEKSNGVCAFSGPDDSFSCNCANGFNTSSTCFFVSSYNSAFTLIHSLRPLGVLLISSLLPIFLLFM